MPNVISAHLPTALERDCKIVLPDSPATRAFAVAERIERSKAETAVVEPIENNRQINTLVPATS